MHLTGECIWIWAEKQLIGDRVIVNKIYSPRSAPYNIVRMFHADTTDRDGHGFRELR
jgi:hypothetical protein